MSLARLKIGFVLDDTLDSTDGIQQYMLTLSDWLRGRGHEVYFIVGESHRTDLPNLYSMTKNIRVKFNGNAMSMPSVTPVSRVRNLLEKTKLDVLHVQMPYSPCMSGVVLRCAAATQAVVGTFHILPYGRLVTWANRALKLLTWPTDRRFDSLMAVSPPAAAFAARAYGYKASVVPNPVDVDRFLAGKAKGKSRLPHVVFLGRLVERKGALQLLQAVAYLRETLGYAKTFAVTIGGKGAMLAQLQDYAVAHGLEKTVTFAGFVSEDDKADFLAGADVAVFPSISGESFGISVVEALAAARGVVLAGDNPGYASVLHGLHGRLIDPENTPAFAEALRCWLDDAPARRTAAAEQKTYAAQFDVEAVGRQVEAVYQQALQKRRAS